MREVQHEEKIESDKHSEKWKECDKEKVQHVTNAT